MKEIALNGKKGEGKFAIVDDDDFEKLNKHKWYLAEVGTAKVPYVKRYRWDAANKRGTTVCMHREVMNELDPKVHIDHEFGNTFDNRKEVLRRCNASQNISNQKHHLNTSSIYKGVSWDGKRNKWCSYITTNRKKHHLGRFRSEIEAAFAYNQAAILFHGEFARLNEINFNKFAIT